MKLHTLLLLTFLSKISFAQIPDPVVAKAFYKFSYKYDTIRPNLVKTERFTLVLGKTASLFKSYDKMKQDSEIMANYKLTGAMAPPKGNRATGDELYYFFSSKKYFLNNKILGNYIINKPYNDLVWKIHSKTKKIENFNCQMATTNFGGRNYIAWFCTDLPFNAGPWKLHGLPGLILNVHDETDRIQFNFDGFSQVKNSIDKISWSSKAIEISSNDFEKLAKAFENDPEGMVSKQYGVTNMTHSSPMKHINILKPNPLINFPLEVESHTDK